MAIDNIYAMAKQGREGGGIAITAAVSSSEVLNSRQETNLSKLCHCTQCSTYSTRYVSLVRALASSAGKHKRTDARALHDVINMLRFNWNKLLA